MQVEGWRVEPEAVLRQRCDSEDARTAVHVPDALLRPAQIGVGHGRTVSKVQLNVCPQRVALKTAHRAKSDYYSNSLAHFP